ncbi:MAG: M28 family peptidase [Oscillospiraceae bacterium]|nr:M28 family peptidase [Oscillospiraceae bacterium]
MIRMPMDILEQYPVRKSGKQKQAFRDAVEEYAHWLDYETAVEKGSFGAKNLIIGNPEKAEYLLTAHYDTCARLPFPNLITPCNFWTFLAYQLFVVAVIFAAAGICGGIVYLLSSDGFLAYWTGYLLIWVMLVLMMVGPANRHNANDNTSGVVAVLEMARSLPKNRRDKVCFVLFDLEEAGLLGSASYRKTHKKNTDHQIVLNLDCVGDGDEILMFPTRKLRKDDQKMKRLRSACGSWGEKSISLCERGFSVYPSDQANFPFGVGIAAMRRGKRGILYCSRIHTHKDTNLEITNVNILRASLVSMICSPAAE